ncbi:TetR/AcrR family transcriptional regulator [Aminipila butyrica]|uniref:TetR/AcrR family transcriptional regulator n=1 Tax=Aminipila butyrica TaxID=433296 RepID=A0A858BUZ3_9FIRM|nr:TetR/AcrR family transcriptional regulator [Aminipila butyrica]QIB68908.1 TetR/AcrR family transcriptional regulator [Aminipila butyrica]
MEESSTLQNILNAAKTEFLQKGFQTASLRNIVKNAGVTTGAFYGYFSNKEALFAALVEKHASAIMGRFMCAQEEFMKLPEEEQPESMSDFSGDCMAWMVDYIYEHFDVFRLIICCSEGTAYADFVHAMVEVEVESTYRFMESLRSLGHQVPELDRQFCHIVCSGMFNGVFEMVVHQMPQADAKIYISQLQQFHRAGWMNILGL